MAHKPSKNQRAIYDAFRKTDSNLVVRAVPGSGKTTTITNLTELVPIHETTAYFAFNKAIVETTINKIPKNRQKYIDVKTIHAFGMGVIFQHYSKKSKSIKVNSFKNILLFDEFNEKEWKLDEKKAPYHAFICSQLIDGYRLNMCKSKGDLIRQAIKSDIDYLDEDIERALQLMKYLDEQYNLIENPNKDKIIDFVDMLYLPVKYDLKCKQYQNIFIDEAQDLSKLQQALITKTKNPMGSRFVAVGDPKQAIYGFLGADAKSFENFLSNPNTIELPLGVTYRLSRKNTTLANTIYPVIECFEEAVEGEVLTEGSIFDMKSGDFGLCRNNQPLVEVYLELVGKKQKVHIKGKDLGEELLALIKPLKSSQEMGSYFSYLLTELENELKKVYKIAEPKNHGKYRYLVEKMSICGLLKKKFESVDEMRTVLIDMYSDNIDSGIILSTIHKSKGLETDNVFIIGDALTPSSYATTPEALEQEMNLKFVSYSRAKLKTVFITDFIPSDLRKEQSEMLVENKLVEN